MNGDGTTEDEEARHPIAVVADRTGLSVHQLRAWERRYGPDEGAIEEEVRRLRDRLPTSVRLFVGGRGAERVAVADDSLEVATGFGQFGERLRRLERTGPRTDDGRGEP